MRRLSGDPGSVTIIVALSLTMLLGIAALAIDVGGLLAEQRAVQNGADAAAIAIAKQCAEHAVDPDAHPAPCTDALASTYLDENSTSPVTPSVELATSYSGKVGRVTVTGQVASPSIFARFLGVEGPVTASAAATARWGPLTAVDEVFPLVVCKGALPPVGESVRLVVDHASGADPEKCDGAPDEQPFGWITPHDPSACTSKITLLPSIYLDVLPADQDPDNAECQSVFKELHHDIRALGNCHTTPSRPYLHCHGSGDPEARTRVLAVYDAQAGSPSSRPAHSLIAFEFVGARFAGEASYFNGSWPEPCTPPEDPAAIDDMQCIEGVVQNYIPPTDGPIFDPAIAALLPNIDDTTVLDVRLVD
ncbi:MAG: hypothetical protein KY460_11475 [Actinobacteria bacterium]|nr:hypothetical protein [Actinomycetota bacterium]